MARRQGNPLDPSFEEADPHSPYMYIVLGTLVLLVGIWASVEARSQAELANATARALDRAKSAARSFEQYAERTLQAADNLTRIAVVSLAHNTPAETLRRSIQTNILDGELFQSLNIQDADGDLIGSTISSDSSLNYADRAYFRAAMNSSPDELIIGEPVVSRITGKVAIPVARRFNAPDGNAAGVVLVQVRADAFARGYRELDIKGNDYVALIGFDGIARAGTAGGKPINGLHFQRSNVFLQQKRAQEGTFSDVGRLDGAHRHVAYRTMTNYPLFVAVGIDAEHVRAEHSILRMDFVGLGLLSMGFVVVFMGGLASAFRQRDAVNKRLRASEASLRFLANRDHLTGLPNRATLETLAGRMLDEARASGTAVACVFIDLDNFGDINAALGHPVGDKVLKAVAAALLATAGESGHVARIGGDEFVVLLQTSDHGSAQALEMANSLRAAVESVAAVDGTRVTLKGSFGLSLFPGAANSFPELVRQADEAMLHSKRSRRGVPALFSPSMDRLADKRLTMQGELAEALAQGALDVFYQPKIEFSTKRVVGIEGLVRWRHPTLGQILPRDFIPIAEETGLIVPLGEWVLRRACRDCVALGAAGFDNIPVAVNVSALQFRQPDFVGVVTSALHESGLLPALLELELTESMIADEPDAIIARLEMLKSLGVMLAIDDFGTGYSNLQYLRRFPIDVLKIDKSFVAALSDDRSSRSIVMAILALAKALELRVVAEGVETTAQETFLSTSGCTVAQGYLYARPMPVEELEVWLTGWSRAPAYSLRVHA